MLALKEFRDRPRGLADLLNWAAVIDDGIVINKDSGLMAAYYYRGEDTASSSQAALATISAQLNAAFCRLGSGWMLHVDAIRLPAVGYTAPERNHFPDQVTLLIDEERRRSYLDEGAHYETAYAITLTWTPPSAVESKAASVLFKGGAAAGGDMASQLLARFRAGLNEFEIAASTVLSLQRMKGVPYEDEYGRPHVRDELLSYLNYCLVGTYHPVNLPPVPMYLDAVLGVRDFIGGLEPRIENRHLRVVAIDGFPQESYPGILDALNTLPVSYRWSTRFILLDPEEGKAELNRYRKKWRQQIFGLKSALLRTNTGAMNHDAAELARDAEMAMSEATAGMVRYGFFTSVVILSDDNLAKLNDAVDYVRKTVQNLGFATRVEGLNAVEAWLGSLPGHGVPNIRRPLLHSLNVADLLPTTAVWPGPEINPCPFYGHGAPPLLYANTTGATPFRMNLHVGDVGHTMILGPTGAGKSTLLAFLGAQHLRYEDAQVFVFDKGYSSYILCNAVGGRHFDIAGEHGDLAFYPLEKIDRSGQERAWAAEWIEGLLTLQKVEISPAQRKQIQRAVDLLANAHRRTLTELVSTIQDMTLRDALQHYTLSGAMGYLLDASEDGLSGRESRFMVFELEHLMSLGEKNVIPVLTYLFHRVEQRLDGRPTLLILDEAWMMLDHPIFREQVRQWLKVFRKANCAIVFATQSISDVAKSPIADVLFESCPTKILLPNREARQETSRAAYARLGLNDRQIDLISVAAPKRQYYYMSPLGRRLFDLALGPATLAFVGKSSKPDVETARGLIQRYGGAWVEHWLAHCGI